MCAVDIVVTKTLKFSKTFRDRNNFYVVVVYIFIHSNKRVSGETSNVYSHGQEKLFHHELTLFNCFHNSWYISQFLSEDPCRNSYNRFHLVGYNLLYVHVFPSIHILYDGLLDAHSHRWHTTIGFYKFRIHDYPIVDS